MKRKKDRGWGKDPMVPIRGEHVKAAMEERGLNPWELATRLGKASREHPRLLHILDGMGQRPPAKRCRSTLRKKLAKTLKVPETWLEGHTHLPYTWDRPGRDKDGNTLISLRPPLARGSSTSR